MELIEQVREIRADEAVLGEMNVRVARAALSQEIIRGVAPQRRRIRRARAWAGLGIGGLVAGAAVTAIVVGSVVAPVAVPNAAAAEVFEAAAQSVTTNDPALSAGQYRRTEVTTEYLFTNSDNGVPRDPSADSGFIERVTTVYFVPADRADDWIVDDTAPREVIEMIGDGAQRFLDSVRAGGDTREDRIVAIPAGVQGGAPLDRFRDLYDTLPRDPDKLRAWAKEEGQGSETKVLMDLVWLDLPPADLRSAAYRALAQVPGFEVKSTQGELTTLEHSADIGNGETLVSTLEVNVESGEMRSYTSSILKSSGDGIAPEGVPDMRITFNSSIVDAAP
ncbi:MAG TPA: hypothetical protein VFF85_00710 [Microbacterium sp.]|nr:hypothetical protein [Microbacterium sp.]